MRRILCVVLCICFLLFAGCNYQVVENDGGYEKVVAPDGTAYYWADISVVCCFDDSLDKLKENTVAEIHNNDVCEYFALSDDGSIGILYSIGGLSDYPSLFYKEGYDMPSITKPDKVEALYYIPYEMYDSSENEGGLDEDYYENFRLPVERNDAVEFIKGLSQYTATDTEGYGGDTYYGYLIVKYTDLDLFFRYVVWTKAGFYTIQIQGDTFNDDFGMYDYYTVPAEYLSPIPLADEVKE